MRCGRRGAGGGTRTPKGFRPRGPKPRASASFATPAARPSLGPRAAELQQTRAPACMFRNMPPERTLTPGYTVIHPNRDKAICKTTKAIIVLILLVSIGLMLIITFGGWSKLQGLKPINFAWCILYLI